MNIAEFLPHLKNHTHYQGQIVHIEHIQPQEAEYGSIEQPLDPKLLTSLEHNVLLPLYKHQVAAINEIHKGKNVIIATPTASGKTLCYTIPVLNTILTKKNGRALYLYPTKALAQDQLRSLQKLSSVLKIKPRYATFDGDTPVSERGDIKKSSDIVLSNPDMIHVGVLPNHQSWATFLARLKYIVIDEAHTYRGVLGSHVANVIRRLRRLCNRYGSDPQMILCSATIANAQDHAENLTGLPFDVVDKDSSPHGGKEFVFWNPSFIDKEKSTRRSANSEATMILTELLFHQIRSLAFARTRRLTELIYMYVKDQIKQRDPQLSSMIKPYRAGYLAEERREIERDLFEGKLITVVATTALELGIDIGDLDATVLTGYPGSIASTWQQAGRSGRRSDMSLSILIGLNNPLDQYIMNNPGFFFGKNHENALINPNNPHILKPHLVCASWELPLSTRDELIFGPTFIEECTELEGMGLLHKRRGHYYPSPTIKYPAQDINIRSSSSQQYALVEATSGRLLELIEEANAFFQIHPGAVYLHQGESYTVIELDLIAKIAYAQLTEDNYYTQTKDITEIRILRTDQTKNIRDITVCLGEVEVTTTVIGFKKKRIFTDEVIGEVALALPPHTFRTIALWFDIGAATEEILMESGLDFPGGLHATEHASIALLPLFALCDRNDIGGVSTPFHPDTGKAQVFIYDAHAGGVGISEKGFELITQLWQATLQTIVECPCADGCPACTQSPKCGNNNEPLDKKAAIVILKNLLSKNI